MISKETFCQAIRMIQEQNEINNQFEKALDLVGNGHFVYGVPNKYYDALMLVLKEDLQDDLELIEWWFYEAPPDYEILVDNHAVVCLKEPEALYDFIVNK